MQLSTLGSGGFKISQIVGGTPKFGANLLFGKFPINRMKMKKFEVGGGGAEDASKISLWKSATAGSPWQRSKLKDAKEVVRKIVRCLL